MKGLLFYVDGHGGVRPFDWTWIDKWAGLYGYTPVAVDIEGHYRTKNKSPFCFHSLEEAVECPQLKNHLWIWMDHTADQYLDELPDIPPNHIICVGCDVSGFQGQVFPGPRVRIRPPSPASEGEWFACMVVPLALFEVQHR